MHRATTPGPLEGQLMLADAGPELEQQTAQPAARPRLLQQRLPIRPLQPLRQPKMLDSLLAAGLQSATDLRVVEWPHPVKPLV